MMKNETQAVRDAMLDDLLIRWWQWKTPIQPARGHGSVSLGFESFRVTRQYDDQNGALFDDEEAGTMKLVEREVNFLDTTHRVVIYVLARALTVGAAVFASPRIPQDKAEQERAVAQARQALADRLTGAGLM